MRARRLRDAAFQVLAVAAAAATMVASVRAGPPGWDGPWPESGAMVRLYSEPLPSIPPPRESPITGRAVQVTLTAMSPVPPGGVTVLRDGFPAARAGDVPAVLMVHVGDILTLVDDDALAARVQLRSALPLAAPAAGPWVVPPHGRLRLPAVALSPAAAR